MQPDFYLCMDGGEDYCVPCGTDVLKQQTGIILVGRYFEDQEHENRYVECVSCGIVLLDDLGEEDTETLQALDFVVKWLNTPLSFNG